MPASGSAQRVLEQFSYDQLRFSGIQLTLGPLGSSRLRGTLAGALRVDYGQIAPSIRVLVGVGYYRAEFSGREIGRFTNRLRQLVSDPENNFTIDVGTIRWSDVAADLDLQYAFPQGRTLTTYLGLGLGVHFRNGSGAAIDGTFVEDALDTIGAGLAASLGTEIALSPAVRLVLDARGVLSSDLNTVSLGVGLKYQAPARAGAGGGP